MPKREDERVRGQIGYMVQPEGQIGYMVEVRGRGRKDKGQD